MPSRAPAGELERSLLVEAWQDALGELVGRAEHVVGAEADAGPLGIGLARPQAGVGQGQLGGGHAHLALAAHHLQPLADGLLLLFFQGAEVVDLAGELPGLGGHVHGRASAGSTESGPTPLRPLESASQRASLVLPRGLIAPRP